MKIAYLAKEYPPYGINFASAIFYPPLARELVKRGHEVHVISQASREQTIFNNDGVAVHLVGHPSKKGDPLARMRYNLESTRALRDIIRREGIQIVESNVTFGEGFVYSLLKMTPLVLQSFAFSQMFIDTKTYSSSSELFTLRLSALLEDISIKLSDVIIANSPSTYDFLADGKRIDPTKLVLIPEARLDFNVWKFKQTRARERFGIPDNSITFLYVGWFQSRKGIQILFEAIPRILKQLPEAMFVFVGRDTPGLRQRNSYMEYMLTASKKAGFRSNLLIFDNFLTTEELIELYSMCDIVVSPSLSETFGWPVIEAMACGKMVVATDTGIAPELARLGGHIQVAQAGSVNSLVESIAKAVRNLSEESTIASTNRSIVERTFDFNKMVNSLEEVYERTISKW